MTVAEKVKQAAAMKAFDYIGKDPEHNIPKVLDMVRGLDDSGALSTHLAGIKKSFADPNNGMRKLTLSLWRDIDPAQLRKMYETMAINSMKKCCTGKKNVFKTIGVFTCLSALVGGGYFVYKKFFKK